MITTKTKYEVTQKLLLQQKSRTKKLKRKRKYSSAPNKTCHRENIKDAFSIAMSTWVENFKMASDWQMKHQLAYWKARAKTLEYENKLLHDVIKKNFFKTTIEQKVQEENYQEKIFLNQQPIEENTPGESYEQYTENEECIESDNDEFVVSEEFIEFIQRNKKFKEDAKRERERLRELNKPQIEDEDIMTEDKLKEIYGDLWQRVCASEMSLLSDFMKKKEKHNASFWPNIPLNLS